MAQRVVVSATQSELLKKLPEKVAAYVQRWADVAQPSQIEICDGSAEERSRLMSLMQKNGQVKPLKKLKNCWLTRTDPADVARVESKTFMCTNKKGETIPTPRDGTPSQLGNWMSLDGAESAYNERFPGCMKGRTMYVVPFSMGPVGGPISKLGVELTDSPYVVASMRIMTRMGAEALQAISGDDFTGCMHSVGQPLPLQGPQIQNWPCNPSKTIVTHLPYSNEIVSYGSGYGGNSLLGKKCLALRMGSIMGRNEGWLAEHMVIMGITPPNGPKRYVAAAFPSACGKTNLAMLTPTIPGYKIECVGDDIAWLKFDSTGRLRAINPEAGFFGVAPGTSMSTNPNAMASIMSDTVFTNTAETSTGGFYWEGLEKEHNSADAVTDWKGNPWNKGSGVPAAHPNSRFCAPLRNCPILDPAYNDSEGVPIDAIIFGGRRPTGVPLVFEAFNWDHGVMMGAAMRSEATAAAEHKAKTIMHDPFAMRPFLGYNFGHFLDHWVGMQYRHQEAKLPKIFQVNWFRKDPETGGFLWPGFGENIRVLDWILRRLDPGTSEKIARPSPIGFLPTSDAIDTTRLDSPVDMAALFHLQQDFWRKECSDVRSYLDNQVGDDLPAAIRTQLDMMDTRVDRWQL